MSWQNVHYGVLASRPSASGLPDAYEYFATNDNGGTLYMVQGGAWVKLAPGVSETGGGAVSSVFTRTGAVVAANGDYYGAVASALTGATAASRYVGATSSGAPGSGTFSTGDFVIAQNGHVFVCTSGGSPGTWADVGSGGGAVSSVFTRTGAVTAQSGDYTASQVGALASSSTIHGIAAANANDGDVTLNSHKLTNVTDPGSAQDAATKAYVDAHASTLGRSALVYRYTVTGSDKASIDTGSDTADAGSNDWTNGDLLEIWISAQTDAAGASTGLIDLTVNNDTGANYDRAGWFYNNTTAGGSPSLASTAWILSCHGHGGTAGYASTLRLTIPHFAGTTFFKTAELLASMPDGTAANNLLNIYGLGWRSTSAMTRLKVAGDGSSKLKVGSTISIYKRLAS
jgi:hypothetical protein